MSIELRYPDTRLFGSFYQTLAAVGAERIYIEMVEPPTFDEVAEFQNKLIQNDLPVYYAVDDGRVVGWCDISRAKNPRLSHRGHLGMGLLKSHRGQGLGTRLLTKTLEHAKRIGIEKVELTVYTSNTAAIALYKKLGFEQEGLVRRYRKLDGQYFDCLMMGKFF